MAYKGKRKKKVPIYKKPAFWLAIAATAIILVLVIWIAIALSTEVFTIRKPDATEAPVSQTRPEETEEATEEPAPVEETPAQEAFEEGWEPEYDEPIAEYVPPRPILVHPRSRLRELKKKLVAGPEKQYYTMLEKGFGKLQAAIFFSLLVAVISGGATIMYALGAVAEHRMRLMVFGQFFALLLSALLGSFQLIEGLADMKNKQFSLNSLLVFSFVLCCVDGILCLSQLRVPCCAAFSLQMTMSLWSAYQKRSTKMGQLDTMRKANHLDGLTVVEEYHEGAAGILRKEAQVEDFMDHYQDRNRYEKTHSVYAVVALCLSVATGIAGGVLAGLRNGEMIDTVSFAIQVAAVTTLAALPASMFVCLSRPMALLEKRLHKLNAVLCGWRGVEALSKNAVFPLDHEDVTPTGSVKLNGVKFYGDRESDEVVACCAALCSAAGGALKPLFEHLLESRNGIRYEVVEFRAYENGGVGGWVNAEPVLVGSLAFLKEKEIEVPEGIKVPHCVGISIGGEFCGLFAIAYEKNRNAAAGLATLTGYRKLKALITSGDFMLTEQFLKDKFSVNTKRVIIPDPETKAALSAVQAEEDAPVAAISTGEGIAPFAYCVTGAKSLKRACCAGTVVHLIGGILGIVMMVALAVLGAREYLTPANMLLYQLVWLVPGLLITNWTRPL
jgi:succinate dehydrogenase hydrophobic anchor subunit